MQVKGLPKDVADKLVAALEKAWNSKEYKEFMDNRGFGMIWGNPADFAKLWE